MNELHLELNWNEKHDPSLSDLHPSLGNLDHMARLINELREQYFPNGTGLDGM